MASELATFNPFPGLRPFRQDEDYLFFGRERQTMELLQKLGSHRFVAVVGTSGSGKSSLVRCGLLSELQGGKLLRAGASWEIAVTHPGGNPFGLLTDALLDAGLYDTDEEDVREQLLATLSRSHFGLIEAVRQARLPDGTNFVLVVDQFEEIFRFHEAGQSQQEMANEFVSLLLESVAQTEVRIYVVLTMRSDFIGDCSQFEGLAESVNRGEYLIPRLTRDQYKQVIEAPIRVAGGRIVPRLLQRLLNDLAHQMDQLPCLQHALMRTWDVAARRGASVTLDLEDYERVGRMSQALSLHADEVYESLGDDRRRELCAGLFQALTVRESESRGIRRPQRLAMLCRILDVPPEELVPIIDAYRQLGVTFLMPSPDVELTPRTIIDISHESLMRVWTRLRHWVEEEAQAVNIYKRLSESAALHGEGKAGLYRQPELGIAVSWRDTRRPNAAWAERYDPGFDSAMAFLRESESAADEAERQRELARQRELQQAKKLAEAQQLRAEEQKRAATRMRIFAVGLAAIAVVAGLAFLVAVRAQRIAAASSERATREATEAERSRRDAEVARRESERLKNEAERSARQLNETLVLTDFGRAMEKLDAGDPRGSLGSLARAMRQDDSYWPAAMRAFSTMTQRAFVTDDVFTLKQDNPISGWDVNPKSNLAWTVDRDRRGYVWDLSNGKQLYPLAGGEQVERVTFTNDGTLIFVRTGPVVQGRIAKTGQPLDYQITGGRFVLADTDDGRGIIVWAAGRGRLRVRDRLTGEPIAGPLDAGDNLAAWEVSPDGRKIAAVCRNLPNLVVWNAAEGTVSRQASFDRPGTGVEFSSDSRYAVVRGGDRALRWWAVDSARSDREPDAWVEFESPVAGTFFVSSHGKIAVECPADSASPDSRHEFHLFDLDAQDPRRTVVAPSRAISMPPFVQQEGFDAVGFVSTNQLEIRSLTTGERLSETSAQPEVITSAGFSPDGRIVYTLFNQRTLRFWDTLTGEPVNEPIEHEGNVYMSVFGPSGETFLTTDASAPNSVRIWNVADGGSLIQPFSLASGVFIQPRPVGGDTYIANRNVMSWSSGELSEGTLTVWNADTSTAADKLLKAPGGGVSNVGFSSDGALALAGGSESGVGQFYCYVWETDTRRLIRRLRHSEGVRFAAFDSTGKRIATASAFRAVVWDVESGQAILELPHDGQVFWAKFSPDDRRLLTSAGDGNVRLWDLRTGEGQRPITRLKGGTFSSSRFSADGGRILLAGELSDYQVVDADSGKILQKRQLGDFEELWQAHFSPDGKHLAYQPARRFEAYLLNVDTGIVTRTLLHDEPCRDIGFSPDGKLLATGGGPRMGEPIGSGYLWNLSDERSAPTTLEHRAYVNQVRFSPDGEMLLTGTAVVDGSFIQVWHVDTGKPLTDRIHLRANVSDIAFRPDGAQVLAGSQGGEVRLVDLPPRETPNWLPALVEAIAGEQIESGLGRSKEVDRGQLAQLREELLASSADDSATRWARWILGDRRSRPPAPGANETMSRPIDGWIRSDDPRDLREALRRNPSNAQAHARLGYLLAHSNEQDGYAGDHRQQYWLDAARWHGRRAVELDRLDADVLAHHADILLQAGDADGAREMARRAVSVDPENINATYMDAVTNAVDGRWEEADQRMRRALGLIVSSTDGQSEERVSSPLMGPLADLEPRMVWFGRRDVRLPDPIDGTFDDFDSVPEGDLPDGWTARNHTDDGRSAGTLDLNEIESDSFRNWLVLSQARVPRSETTRVFTVKPNQFLNGEPVTRLLDGGFLCAPSFWRSGNQVQYVFTPVFDCSNRSGVHVAFSSSYIQNQDKIASLEYSVDQGHTWLPVFYRLDAIDIVRDENLEIDAVATFSRRHSDAPTYRDADGRLAGGAYGAFIAAKPDDSLAEYVSPGHDDDRFEFMRIEVFRLPGADGQKSVQLRFGHAGTDSHFWCVDDFGLYEIGEDAPALRAEPDNVRPTMVARAHDAEYLFQLADRLLDGDDDDQRAAMDARLLAKQGIDRVPENADGLAVWSRALARTGATDEALAAIDKGMNLRPEIDRFWATRGFVHETIGRSQLAQDRRVAAGVCFELADMLQEAAGSPDPVTTRRLMEGFIALGNVDVPQVVLPAGSVWKFLDDGSDQGTEWRQPEFDDRSWRRGPAPLGYGDPSPVTRVGFGRNPNDKYVTTYFRGEFVLESTANIKRVLIELQRDDGAVVYLNGREVVRDNLPPRGDITYRTFADDVGQANESEFAEFNVSPSVLVKGRNVVAVEVHQTNRASSDLGLDMRISVSGIDIGDLPKTDELASVERELAIPESLRVLLWTRRAGRFLDQDNVQRAEECLDQALTMRPDDPGALALAARVEFQRDRFPEAEEAYGKAVASALAMRSAITDSRRLFLRGAIKELSRVADDSPATIARSVERMLPQSTPRDNWELELLQRQLERLAPEDPGVTSCRAQVLTRVGKLDEADALLGQAIDERPGDRGLWIARGELLDRQGLRYRRAGEREKAATCFEAADVLLNVLDAVGQDDARRRAEALVALGRMKYKEILPAASTWKYLDDGSDLGDRWTDPMFDDSTWKSGPGKFGYSRNREHGEVTRVEFGPDENYKFVTTYFRTQFDANSLTGRQLLLLSLLRDDAAVVYLNGQEILRDNLPEDAITIDTLAETVVGEEGETNYLDFTVITDRLRQGRNVVAAEVHQISRTSSDLCFDLRIANADIDASSYPSAGELEAGEGPLELALPLKSLLWMSRARWLCEQGHDEKCDEFLALAGSWDERDPNVWWVKARKAMAAGDVESADQAYKTAVDLSLALVDDPRAAGKRLLLLGGLTGFSRLERVAADEVSRVADQLARSAHLAAWELTLLARRARETTASSGSTDQPVVDAEQATTR